MKAHQNQDMRNDEMNDHAIYMERRNLREVAFIVLYTRNLAECIANEPGFSRSCATRDGSCRWMSPSFAVLTGVEAPCAPPTTRGGVMK